MDVHVQTFVDTVNKIVAGLNVAKINETLDLCLDKNYKESPLLEARVFAHVEQLKQSLPFLSKAVRKLGESSPLVTSATLLENGYLNIELPTKIVAYAHPVLAEVHSSYEVFPVGSNTHITGKADTDAQVAQWVHTIPILTRSQLFAVHQILIHMDAFSAYGNPGNARICVRNLEVYTTGKEQYVAAYNALMQPDWSCTLSAADIVNTVASATM